MAREFLNRRSCRKRFGVWTEAVRVTVERRREGMATETFEENFLHRRKKVTIRLTQLPHRPAGMHKRAIGQARLVDARNDIRHMVRVCRGSFGSAGESSNKGLRGDRRGGREELASLLPPVLPLGLLARLRAR